ncbi:MAG: hypothetical protein RL167_112, partial [Actinomycetota bacterium]
VAVIGERYASMCAIAILKSSFCVYAKFGLHESHAFVGVLCQLTKMAGVLIELAGQWDQMICWLATHSHTHNSHHHRGALSACLN